MPAASARERSCPPLWAAAQGDAHRILVHITATSPAALLGRGTTTTQHTAQGGPNLGWFAEVTWRPPMVALDGWEPRKERAGSGPVTKMSPHRLQP